MDDPHDPGGGYKGPRAPHSQNFSSQMDIDPPNSRKRPPQSEENIPPKKTITNLSQTSPSIQSTYTHPDFVERKTRYCEDDIAPFLVHVSKTVTDVSAGPTLKPIKFGHFLFRNSIKNVIQDGVKRIGRNRVSVEFKSAAAANAFLEHPALQPAKFEANIPSYNVTRMGIVRDVPVEWTLEELVQSVEVPAGCGAVIKARRLNRKKIENNVPTWIPTQSVVLTFSGQKLPNRIFCFFTSLPVEVYVLPIIQCNKCCRFGHISTQCRSAPRCFICSQPHEGITCSKSSPLCLFCSGPHSATDTSCPEHSRQKSIKLVMSQESISYLEASARFPQVRRSFADTARMTQSFPSTYPPTIHTDLSQPLHPNSQSSSYKKTVNIARRPYSAALSPGYDREAHCRIVDTPASTTPNGCALLSPNPPQQENLLELLLSTLINIISKMNDVALPNNVYQKLTQLISIFNNVPNNPTVELSQH